METSNASNIFLLIFFGVLFSNIMVEKIAVVLIMVLGLLSCTQTKYFVRSDVELSQLDFENNIVNFIPVMDGDLKISTILDTTYKLLLLEKYAKLNKFLSSVRTDTPDLYLAKTLYHISKTNYQEAANYLRKINGQNYDLVKALLSIDLSYELAKLHDSKDFRKFLGDYNSY